MSNERDPRSEDRLSDAYRSLAEERAPDYLNEKVLRLAAGTRTRYSRARAWMRPAAWAAVIGLSLAIVLDMTRLPSVGPDSIGISLPDSRKVGDQRRETSDTVNDDRGTEAEAVVAPSATPVEQRMEARKIQPARSASSAPERRSNEYFVPKDMTVLRDAEEMARTRAGSDQGPIMPSAELDDAPINGDLQEKMEAGVTAGRAAMIENVQADEDQAEDSAAAASFATRATTEPPASARYCAESVRKEPESWIACVRQLEKNGQQAEARDEYEEFRRVFPDFDAQDGD